MKNYFKACLSQLYDLHKDDVFENLSVSREYKGLTFCWVNRFDSGDLFDRFGARTGENHFMTLSKN